MVEKTLNAVNTKKLVNRIRASRNRSLNLRSWQLINEEGKKTVLELKSGSGSVTYGKIRANSSREADSLVEKSRETSKPNAVLTIGWDSNRNEKVVVNFTD